MLAQERDIDVLAEKICSQSCSMLNADAAFILLSDKKEDLALELSYAWGNKHTLDIKSFTSVEHNEELLDNIEVILRDGVQFTPLSKSLQKGLIQESIYQKNDDVLVLYLPLYDRNKQINGLLAFTFIETMSNFKREQRIGIAKALAKFISIAIEGSELLESQEELLKSFIRLLAGAIDTKSPYTGAHCQRVPTLTMMLAEAATQSNTAKLKNFSLTSEQWNELKTAAWLHDCGKVTTPENVVDKATKLETIYNRIHEVRMRFEVLRRDAHINSLQSILSGEDRTLAKRYLANEISTLEKDFSFIAQCNLGEENISAEAIIRINQISERKWLRYFDDALGLSAAEKERKPITNAQLPVQESLLADKLEHCIAHIDSDLPKAVSKFRMKAPKYRFNFGELNNLAISRGTINEEERYIINHHIVQTIEMLEQLPFPDNLKRVPEIAGSHHEQLNGKGYPKGLKADNISIEARILTIADIFEALTASDRPYKEAKSLSQSIAIMDYMRKSEHIDSDLFELFLSSGTYLEYAREFLKKEQIDEVDIKQYLISS
jgi:HD-GYP domain-containing protein (c-di-GMP phosphodiesterase class II)